MSSSAAEWITLFNVISVKLPVMARVDNMGAIFIGGNIATTSHTKHMDIRHKCVIVFVESGIVKIVC